MPFGNDSNEKPGPAFQPEARRPTTPLAVESLIRSNTPDSVRSSSRARWDRLRQQVLPSASHHGHSQQASSASSVSSITLPARPQTPKPSRLARLGFRQVVEQVREAEDVSQKFSDDVLKACGSSRFVEPLKNSRFDRDGPPSYLPFQSNFSLPPGPAPNSSVIGTASPGHRKYDFRNPSMQFFAVSSRPVPSLLNVLRQNAPSSGDLSTSASHLPHEGQVTSALLAPFLTSGSGPGIDEERINSVEAFEIAVKTWNAETKEASHQLTSSLFGPVSMTPTCSSQ
jgi:hypothetical protein